MTVKDAFIGVLLVGIGCLQMAGDILRMPGLKAIGAALSASPAPKVFTAQDGFETYANRFYLEWHDASGERQSLEVTPAVYSGLAGPYNRRNAYGAAISYAPVLFANPATRPMFSTVLERTLCGVPAVVAELGVPADAASHGPLGVRIVPRRDYDPTRFMLIHEVNCHEN